MRNIRLAMLMVVAAVAGLGAAEFWDTKPYTEWSDRDLNKVMTDSPWAGKGSLTHARQGANLGTVPDWDIVIAVRSALPLKQALIRREIGQGGTPTPQHEAQLAAVDDYYIISIAGIPRGMAPMLQKVADVAELRRRGKDPLKATQGQMMLVDKNGLRVSDARTPERAGFQLVAQRGGGGGRGGGGFGGFGGAPQEDRSGITATLMLGFPKSAGAISADDNEFDFVTTLGNYNLKRTFKLKDMMFKGQLTL